MLFRSTTSTRALSSTARRSDDHSHHHEEDTTQYPEETFFSSTWAKTLAATASAAFVFNSIPEANEEAWVTNLLKRTATSPEYWQRQNQAHTVLTANSAEQELTRNNLYVSTFQYRAPQGLWGGSPHGVPVGFAVKT